MRCIRVYCCAALSIGAVAAGAAIEESPVFKVQVLQTVGALANPSPLAFPNSSISYYDNTWSASGSIYYPGGAVASFTRSVCDDFLGTETSPYTINRYVIGIVNNNPRTLTFRAKSRFWLDSGANSPGTVFAGTNPVITMSAYTGQVLAISTSIPSFELGKKWFSVVFDRGSWDATPAELNHLGVYLFGPPHVGISEDNLFLTTSPGDFFSSNPVGGLVQFGGAPLANMLGRIESQGSVYLSGQVQLPGCGDLSGRMVTIQVREQDFTPVTAETVVLNSEGGFVFAASFPNPSANQPNINLPRIFRVRVKAPGWLARDEPAVEIGNDGSLLATPAAGIAGDIDDSNGIDLGDFDLFASSYGTEVGNSTYLPEADFDGSGAVDLGDFDTLAIGFGQEGDD